MPDLASAEDITDVTLQFPGHPPAGMRGNTAYPAQLITTGAINGWLRAQAAVLYPKIDRTALDSAHIKSTFTSLRANAHPYIETQGHAYDLMHPSLKGHGLFVAFFRPDDEGNTTVHLAGPDQYTGSTAPYLTQSREMAGYPTMRSAVMTLGQTSCTPLNNAEAGYAALQPHTSERYYALYDVVLRYCVLKPNQELSPGS